MIITINILVIIIIITITSPGLADDNVPNGCPWLWYRDNLAIGSFLTNWPIITLGDHCIISSFSSASYDHWSVSFLFTLLPSIYHKARSLLMTFSQFDSHQNKTKRSPSAWIPSGFRQWVGSNALLQLYQTGGRSWSVRDWLSWSW